MDEHAYDALATISAVKLGSYVYLRSYLDWASVMEFSSKRLSDCRKFTWLELSVALAVSRSGFLRSNTITANRTSCTDDANFLNERTSTICESLSASSASLAAFSVGSAFCSFSLVYSTVASQAFFFSERTSVSFAICLAF